MVLRKVPATAKSFMLPNGPFADGYYTGSDTVSYNMPKKWTTDRDYYIGVFLVTQKQYQDLYGSNPSSNTKNFDGNTVGHRPVERVSWDNLRLATTEPGEKIPVVDSPNTGTFLQRLNFITGNKYAFDLPTFVMSEIAERAGATTVYFWGDEPDAAYMVCATNTTLAVGSRLPNAWGIFDPTGNVFEWVRDNNGGKIQNLPDAFTPCPTVVESDNGKEVVRRRRRGGGTYDTDLTGSGHTAFHSYWYETDNAGYGKLGFRVAVICD
jgi:formylglycine-generating enzyme required for sulfatase activity